MLVFLSIGSASAADIDSIYVRSQDGQSIVLSNIPADDGYVLLLAAPRPSGGNYDVQGIQDEKRGAKFARSVARYDNLIADAAKASRVDARLLHAVVAVESGYNAQALSAKGAYGLMQLRPETARRYGVSDALDPAQNLRAGASYLRDLLHLFNNDIKLALAAYNAGEAAVQSNGGRIPPYRETIAYVPKVLAVYNRLKAFSRIDVTGDRTH